MTVQEERLLYAENDSTVLLLNIRNTQPAIKCHIPGDLNLQATLPCTNSCMTGSGFHLSIRWKQQVSLQCWHLPTRLHSTTAHKTVIYTLSAVRTSHLTW